MGSVMDVSGKENNDKVWRRRTTKKEVQIWISWLIGLSIVLFAWNVISEKTIWFFVVSRTHVEKPVVLLFLRLKKLKNHWLYCLCAQKYT